MNNLYPFQPRGSTTNIAVTATAQTFTLPAVPTEGGTLVLTNIGTQTVFFAFSGTATATTSMPLQSGESKGLTVGAPQATISVIAAAVGSTLYATVGDGVFS